MRETAAIGAMIRSPLATSTRTKYNACTRKAKQAFQAGSFGAHSSSHQLVGNVMPVQ